jgi:hypothetical protein
LGVTIPQTEPVTEQHTQSDTTQVITSRAGRQLHHAREPQRTLKLLQTA